MLIYITMDYSSNIPDRRFFGVGLRGAERDLAGLEVEIGECRCNDGSDDGRGRCNGADCAMREIGATVAGLMTVMEGDVEPEGLVGLAVECRIAGEVECRVVFVESTITSPPQQASASGWHMLYRKWRSATVTSFSPEERASSADGA